MNLDCLVNGKEIENRENITGSENIQKPVLDKVDIILLIVMLLYIVSLTNFKIIYNFVNHKLLNHNLLIMGNTN